MAKKENKIKNEIKEARKKGMGFLNEFKTFIARGNVIDLAVGVIIGNAFSKIVTSLTNNILTPLIGVLIGGFDFSKLSYTFTLWGREVDLLYGVFIQNTVDFLITAFCIFTVIKVLAKLSKKKEEEPQEEIVVKSDEVLLLEEIRDLLKKQK